MRLAFRASEGNRVADRVRLLFTLDLIAKCVTLTLNADLVIDRFTVLALKMGVGCLFRKCKYVKSPGDGPSPPHHGCGLRDGLLTWRSHLRQGPSRSRLASPSPPRSHIIRAQREERLRGSGQQDRLFACAHSITIGMLALWGVWRMPEEAHSPRVRLGGVGFALSPSPSSACLPWGSCACLGKAHGPRARLGGASCALAPSASA